MRTIKLVFDGIPIPKQSFRYVPLRRNGKVVTYRDKSGRENVVMTKYTDRSKVEKFKKMVYEAKQQKGPDFQPFDGYIEVTRLTYVFPYPASFSKKKRESGYKFYKNTKPDLPDNLNKMLFDVLEAAGIIVHDARICKMNNIEKIYGDKPRTEIEMRVIDGKEKEE